MILWGEEGWREHWNQERLREDEMLAFHDEVEGHITQKALAEKFGLKPTRVSLLVRRHVEALELGRMHAELRQRNAEIERLRASAAFTAIAERLWMDLGWLATELEKRSAALEGPDREIGP